MIMVSVIMIMIAVFMVFHVVSTIMMMILIHKVPMISMIVVFMIVVNVIMFVNMLMRDAEIVQSMINRIIVRHCR